MNVAGLERLQLLQPTPPRSQWRCKIWVVLAVLPLILGSAVAAAACCPAGYSRPPCGIHNSSSACPCVACLGRNVSQGDCLAEFECTTCPAFSVPRVDRAACIACPGVCYDSIDYYNPNVCLQPNCTCVQRPANESIVNGRCTPCGGGQIALGPSWICGTCPIGSLLLPGNRCSCQAGMVWQPPVQSYEGDVTPGSCVPCPAGTSSDGISWTCTPCPYGNWSNPGSNNCSACSLFPEPIAAPGASQCLLACGPGKRSVWNGCVSCGVDQHTENSTEIRQSCIDCPLGSKGVAGLQCVGCGNAALQGLALFVGVAAITSVVLLLAGLLVGLCAGGIGAAVSVVAVAIGLFVFGILLAVLVGLMTLMCAAVVAAMLGGLRALQWIVRICSGNIQRGASVASILQKSHLTILLALPMNILVGIARLIVDFSVAWGTLSILRAISGWTTEAFVSWIPFGVRSIAETLQHLFANVTVLSQAVTALVTAVASVRAVYHWISDWFADWVACGCLAGLGLSSILLFASSCAVAIWFSLADAHPLIYTYWLRQGGQGSSSVMKSVNQGVCWALVQTAQIVITAGSQTLSYVAVRMGSSCGSALNPMSDILFRILLIVLCGMFAHYIVISMFAVPGRQRIFKEQTSDSSKPQHLLRRVLGRVVQRWRDLDHPGRLRKALGVPHNIVVDVPLGTTLGVADMLCLFCGVWRSDSTLWESVCARQRQYVPAGPAGSPADAERSEHANSMCAAAALQQVFSCQLLPFGIFVVKLVEYANKAPIVMSGVLCESFTALPAKHKLFIVLQKLCHLLQWVFLLVPGLAPAALASVVLQEGLAAWNAALSLRAHLSLVSQKNMALTPMPGNRA